MRLLVGSHGHLASGMATAIEILAGPQPHLTILDAYVDQRNIDEELKLICFCSIRRKLSCFPISMAEA
ncbi:MAG: hypothetical protein ACLSA6_14830 [Holdemania massiliensis]